MKKIIITSLSVVSILALFSFQLVKTQLRIFVLDDTGKYRQDVEVSLYETVDDYNNSKPVFGPLKTDKKGRVIFQAIGEGPYFVEAVKDDFSNGLTAQQTEKLQKGRINKMNLVISE